ncbi:MAG: glycosyl hydrolase 115 family protein [Rhizomicrobium sp.]
MFGAVAALLLLCLPARAADLTLFDGKSVAAIVTDGGIPIGKAGDLLARDLAALSGRAPTVAKSAEGAKGTLIIVGPLDAPLIASLLKANHIAAAPIAGKWESYGRAVIPSPADPRQKALLIFGSDVRGTIYGVVDLTREMGVSPWEWWADVTIRKVPSIRIDGALRYSREPSVRYRAIFLNDEDFGLKPWAAKTYEPAAAPSAPRPMPASSS